MRGGPKEKTPNAPAGMPVFPPRLVPELVRLADEHHIALPLPTDNLTELLVNTFFASLRTEEHEHHPLRIAIIPPKEQLGPVGWHLFRFHEPEECGARQLVRIARALRSERLFIAVTSSNARLLIVGIARETVDSKASTLKLLAREPGSIEAWIGNRRVLAYAHGRIADAPENVLLATGAVRRRLQQLAQHFDVPEYVDSVMALIRHVANHTYGGILIISEERLTPEYTTAGFWLEPGLSIGVLLERLADVRVLAATPDLLLETLRFELYRTVAEVGRLTALDGATLLDTALNVLGFGLILPVADDVQVFEAADAAASSYVQFPLHQYGARHRAAASYASAHPGSLVFVASADGNMACMLREPRDLHTMMWRFRSGDLSNT